MWQRLVDLMTPQYPKPEERAKVLETRAKLLEERATAAEKEAELQKRILAARKRVADAKVNMPRPNYLRWVVLGVGVLILFLLIKSCM